MHSFTGCAKFTPLVATMKFSRRWADGFFLNAFAPPGASSTAKRRSTIHDGEISNRHAVRLGKGPSSDLDATVSFTARRLRRACLAVVRKWR